MSMHDNMAQAIGNPTRVWCRECGRSIRVKAAVALERGWPKCCTYTMTIDHPSGWSEDTSARRRALAAEEQREAALGVVPWKDRARLAKARGES